MQDKIRKISKLDIGILIGLICLFGYFFIFYEVKEYGDSYQHLNQFPSREPVYALLLQGLSVIFGEYLLIPLGFIQNGLAVISIFWLYKKIDSIYNLNRFFLVGTALALTAPHILTPLVAQSGMIITNSVLTEGIVLSLYYFWFGLMLSVLVGEKKRSRLWWTLVFAVVLSLTRGQLMVCIIVWLIVVVFLSVKEKNWESILLYFLVFVIAFVGKSTFTKCYNYLESGLYIDTVSSKPMMLANVLYVSDIEDGADIEDKELRIAFEQMVQMTKENDWDISHASGNIMERAQFHEAGHEIINFDYIAPTLDQLTRERHGITKKDYFEVLMWQDIYAGEIISDVLPNVLPEFLSNYFVISSLGFVRSVAMDISILPIYAVGIYLLAFICVGYLFLKNKQSKSMYFMLLVLLSICGTVFGTSIMIECVSRYMIYNLPLFYIAGMAMLEEIYKYRCKKGEQHEL